MDILKTAMELPGAVARANEGVPERTVLLIIVQEMQRLYEVARETA